MKSFPHRRLFRKGMRAVDSAMRTPDEDEREAKLDEAIAAFHAIPSSAPNWSVPRAGAPGAKIEYASGENGGIR